MGTLRTDLALRGIGLADERLSFENLNPVDGSATGSDYSQAGPRPGTARADDPKSTLLVEVHHGQGEDLEVYVARSGAPGIDSRAEVLFREKDEEGTGDPLDGWKAWNRPTLLHALNVVDFEATPGLGAIDFDAVVIPSSQKAVLVYATNVEIKSRTFSDVWLGEQTVAADGVAVAVTVLPSGRLYAVATSLGDENAYFSDDDGATWSLYATNVLDVGTTPERARLVVVDDVLLLLTQGSTFPYRWKQWVSRDLGASFDLVGEGDIGRYPELHSLPDGSVVVVYRNNVTAQLTTRRIGSPFDSVFDGIALVSTVGPSADFLVSAMDPDGVLWSLVNPTGTDQFQVFRSLDAGDTWTLQASEVLTLGSSGPRTPNGKLLAIDGALVWLTQFRDDGAGTDEDTIYALTLGGWSTVGADPDAGWGDALSGAITGDLRDNYLPIETPQTPWVMTGAGTDAIVNGVLEFSTSGNARHASRSFPALGSPGRFFGIFQVQHESGGDLASLESGFEVGVADGVDEYRIAVHLSEEAGTSFPETRFRVVDVKSGSTLAEITPVPNLLDRELEFLLDLDGESGTAALTWRIARNGFDNWKTAFSGALTSATPSATGSIVWGHEQAGTAVSKWRLLAYKMGDDPGLEDFLAHGVEKKRGRAIGAIGFPLGGIEGTTPSGRELSEDAVFLALRGGPARRAETQQIPTSYDFGVQNLFAELSPSPSSTWRNLDGTKDQSLAWTFPTKTLVGNSWIFGLLVERQNFRRVQIDFDTSPGGTGTWVQVGQLDLAEGFVGLDFRTDGTDIVQPDKTTTASSGRFIHRNELAGGLVVSGGLAHRIAQNTSGRWTMGDTVDPRIRTEDAGPGGTGTCDLVAPRGMFFLHLEGVVANLVSGIRLRMIASDLQIVGEDYLEAGMVRPVFLVPFGQQPSRGWSQEMTPNTSETVSRSGTIRKRKEGRPARRWSWSWPDGVKMDQLRGEDAPDYLGAASRPPAIAKEDLWTLVWGLLEETEGTERPVVACNVIPKTLGTGFSITDRTLFLLGTLDGSGRFDQVLGDEGINEFGRLPPVSIRELV